MDSKKLDGVPAKLWFKTNFGEAQCSKVKKKMNIAHKRAQTPWCMKGVSSPVFETRRWQSGQWTLPIPELTKAAKRNWDAKNHKLTRLPKGTTCKYEVKLPRPPPPPPPVSQISLLSTTEARKEEVKLYHRLPWAGRAPGACHELSEEQTWVDPPGEKQRNWEAKKKEHEETIASVHPRNQWNVSSFCGFLRKMIPLSAGAKTHKVGHVQTLVVHYPSTHQLCNCPRGARNLRKRWMDAGLGNLK